MFLEHLSLVVARYRWRCHAYCLMSNHYHLLVETVAPTLSRGMQRLNGTYTRDFNRRHERVGHVLQGRYKAILVQKDSYLLEVARYIVLNPVRARMVREAKDWPWSSYRATGGDSQPPGFLTTNWILGAFGDIRESAERAYRDFVSQGSGQPSPWERLTNQIYLGDDAFVERMQSMLFPKRPLRDIPKPQVLAPPRPLAWFSEQYPAREDAIAKAYLSGHYSLRQVGEHFGISDATVSRAVKRAESREVGNVE